jgi:hypothetical protein
MTTRQDIPLSLRASMSPFFYSFLFVYADFVIYPVLHFHDGKQPLLTREAASSASIQAHPSTLRNTTVHCHIHNRATLVSILSQVNPFHTNPSHRSKMDLNIIRPTTYWLSQCSLSPWISQE